MENDGWGFKDEAEAKAMYEVVTPQNCVAKLALVQEKTGLSRRELARMIGVSEATLRRIEKSDSLPTKKFMDQLSALCHIGGERFKAMSESQREKVSRAIGTSGGVVAGVGSAMGAVSAAGAVSGLSAAGITSGLAAIGGGTMLAGIAVVAAIPVATGFAGFGLVKAIKKICEMNNLSSTEVDGRWEIRNIPPKDPPTSSALPNNS